MVETCAFASERSCRRFNPALNDVLVPNFVVAGFWPGGVDGVSRDREPAWRRGGGSAGPGTRSRMALVRSRRVCALLKLRAAAIKPSLFSQTPNSGLVERGLVD